MKALLSLSPGKLLLLFLGLLIIFAAFGFFPLTNWYRMRGLNFVIFSILWYLPISLFYIWLLVVGSATNQRINQEIRGGAKIFKSGLIFTLVWWYVYFVTYIPQMLARQLTPIYQLLELISFFVVIFQIYAIYFVAKNLVMAEKQENVKFKDFSGTFYFFLFVPLGIWLIQSRVNKLFQD